MTSERKVTLEGLKEHLQLLTIARRIDEVVVHHCWKPDASDYRGGSTIAGVRRYHMQQRGWSDNGYHLMVAPNSDLWLCRPMGRSGAHVKGRNAHTIGVSYVANFDAQDPATYEGLETGQRAVALLCERFNLRSINVRFHREFAPKSCPGRRLALKGYQEAVGDILAGDDDPLGYPETVKVVQLPGHEHWAEAVLFDGRYMMSVRDAARITGQKLITAHVRDPKRPKLYLRPK